MGDRWYIHLSIGTRIQGLGILLDLNQAEAMHKEIFCIKSDLIFVRFWAGYRKPYK